MGLKEGSGLRAEHRSEEGSGLTEIRFQEFKQTIMQEVKKNLQRRVELLLD